VLAGIKECNFEKAIGDDGFDERILKSEIELLTKVADELLEMLNTATFPNYFNVGRLVPLSKKKGESVVEIDDIRPIVVKSHLTKICEKVILTKIKEGHNHLLKTKRY
jgi:uncharacterized Fe-S cluster-containing radical SAM superfamily protein